jgi:hypothetical protein
MWTERDEVWDDLGLGHFDPAVATMLSHVTARRFLNHVETWEKDDIFDSSRLSEAKLIKKYKGLRFFDDDEDDGGYFRIRSDRFNWKGKRGGGWVITCDQMLGEDPSTDFPEDKEINESYSEAIEYLVNDTLHDMIKAARQSAGVLLIEAAAAEGKE